MNPTFGDKVEGAHYQTRYGVYARKYKDYFSPGS